MNFSFLRGMKGYQRFGILITSVLVIAVSAYVLLFNLLSFDGAFNSQAAINLYQNGTLTLNYRPNITLQTLLPFQVVNGLFLTMFGNTFLAANLANVLFYLLLFGLCVFLSGVYGSLLLLAFSAVSMSPVFIFKYGFGGYGEIPALTFGLLGMAVLVFRRDSCMANIFAGMLVAFAITTKWVLFLILPSVFLTLFLMKLEKKTLLYFLGAIFVTFVTVSFLQFSHLEPNEMRGILQSLVHQNTPHYGSEYLPQKVHDLKTYGFRLTKIWQAYSAMSFQFLVPIKIGLSFIIPFVAIRILCSRKGQLNSMDIFYVFLASFLFVYLAWVFILNSRWPVRRMLNADVLLYLTAAALPCAARFGKTGRSATCAVLAIFLCTYTLFFCTYTKQHSLDSVIAHESEMRKGLELLPDDYNGFGNGVLEAPLWSFLSGKCFKDLFRDSVFYNCIENNCHNYLFTDRTILNHPLQLNLVLETFRLRDVFEFRGFRISKIEGFNNNGKTYSELIDFSNDTAAQSITRIHDRTRHEMYAPPQFEFNEMAVFLDNRRGLSFIEVEFMAHECHDGKNLKVVVLSNRDKNICDYTITQGENGFQIWLTEKFRGSKIDVYLLLEKGNRNRSPLCETLSANRIPLEYKRIQLLPNAGELGRGKLS